MRDLLLTILVLGVAISTLGFQRVDLHPSMSKKAKKIICTISQISIIVSLISCCLFVTHEIIVDQKTKKITKGLTEITAYYDHINDKLITTDELDEMYEDNYKRTIYANDSGNIYILTVKSEKLFTPEVIKTEVELFKKRLS